MKRLTLAAALLAAGTAMTSASASIGGPTQIIGVTSTIPSGSTTYTLPQIADGNSSDAAPFNGFQGQDTKIGTITFTLDKDYDLNAINLWNDINVRAEGVKSYSLKFYDSTNTGIVSLPAINVVSQVPVQTQTFPTVSGVRRVDLTVESVQALPNTYAQRVEIREVSFEGTASEAAIDVAGDHYQCYRIPESKPLPYENLQIGDQFGRSQVVLGRPVTLCNPSTKIHKGKRYTVSNPKLHLVCYDILKQGDMPRPHRVHTNNQMGPANLTVAERQTFCIPSTKKLVGMPEAPLDQ